MFDIVIIGAGPAGLTSALYALRANKKVLILEAKSYGGQIINSNKIENYPGIISISGFDFATNLYNQVMNLGGIIKYEKVVKIEKDKRVITTENEYHSKAIIIATGTLNKKLNLKKEEEFLGKGISYCATCDGAFYKNKDVAVVGGGNTAIEDALYLSNIVKKVYLIHRHETFKCEEKNLLELKKKDNVEFVLNSNVTSLNGNDFLESIEVTNLDSSKKILEVSGLFIAIGQIPQNEIFKNVVDLDSNGYIITFNEVCTKSKGVYAVGDTRVKDLRQLTTAISDASMAATLAIKEISSID